MLDICSPRSASSNSVHLTQAHHAHPKSLINSTLQALSAGQKSFIQLIDPVPHSNVGHSITPYPWSHQPSSTTHHPFAPPTMVASVNMEAELASALAQIPDSPPPSFNLAATIASLPTVTDTTDQVVVQLKERCTVCHDKEHTQPCRTECGHVFCAECCLPWIAGRKTCPLCRASITTGGCVLLRVKEEETG